jgi:hypothetical protein
MANGESFAVVPRRLIDHAITLANRHVQDSDALGDAARALLECLPALPDGAETTIATVLAGSQDDVWSRCGACGQEATECLECHEYFSPGESLRCGGGIHAPHEHARCPQRGTSSSSGRVGP